MALGIRTNGGAVNVDDIKRQIQGVNAQQAKVQEQRRKQMDGFIRMVMTAAKNQMPGDEKNSTQSDMMHLAGLMGQAQMFDGMQESLDQLSRSLQQNLVIKYQNMMGQQVQVDNSTRTYNGSPITFTYNLDFEQGKLPNGAMVATVVCVSDEKGRKVYEGRGARVPGEHEFVWNGHGPRGEEVPQGEAYTIDVKCSYTYSMNGSEMREEIHAHSSSEGIVEQVVSEGSVVYLMVDGRKVDPDNIIAITDANRAQEAEQLVRMTPAQATALLDKEVTIKPNMVEVKSGKGDVSFIMDEAHRRSNIKVEFFDPTGQLVSVAQHQFPALNQGVNSFTWNGEKARSIADIERARAVHEALPLVDDGVYTYEVYFANGDGSWSPVVNTLESAVVTAIEPDEMGYAWLQCGDGRYDSAWVRKVTPSAAAAAAVGEDHWVDEGRKYFGRMCSFDSFMDYTAGAEAVVKFNLPLLDGAHSYTGAQVEIKDQGGNVVGTVDVPADHLLSKLPRYNQLEGASKALLNDTIRQAQIRLANNTVANSYAALQNAGGEYLARANGIFEALCLSGKLKTRAGQVPAIVENRKYNEFEWDGTTTAGAAAGAGRYYYTIAYHEDGHHAGVLDTSVARVIGFDHDEEGLRLTTHDGSVRASDIKSFVG